MLDRRRAHKQAKGFTIVELLIAIMVFALVLILITTGVIRFSRQYYKGVISGQTQDTARTVVDDITRSIQFNGGDVAPMTVNGGAVSPWNPVTGYCIGQDKRLRFYLDSQVTDTAPVAAQHQARHALVSDTVSGCSSSLPAPSVKNSAALPGSNAREELGAHMRLAKFSITGANNLWSLDIKVVYGDDQLLCSTSVHNGSSADCQNHNPAISLPPLNATDLGNLTCRTLNGAEFCATSELQTTIDKRVKRVN